MKGFVFQAPKIVQLREFGSSHKQTQSCHKADGVRKQETEDGLCYIAGAIWKVLTSNQYKEHKSKQSLSHLEKLDWMFPLAVQAGKAWAVS